MGLSKGCDKSLLQGLWSVLKGTVAPGFRESGAAVLKFRKPQLGVDFNSPQNYCVDRALYYTLREINHYPKSIPSQGLKPEQSFQNSGIRGRLWFRV